jgi:hypothetical protein
MSRFLIVRIAGVAAAVIAATFAATSSVAAAPAPNSASPSYYGPTSYSPAGVPQYGLVGQGVWQVAGIVNAGEPSIRIVYDQTVPGARDRAMSYYYQFTSTLYQFSQPGIVTGLRQVGYTAHYDGVQVQLWGDNPYIDQQYVDSFAAAGIPLIAA